MTISGRGRVAVTSHTQDMVERAKGILPASTDDLLLRGITAETTDRIVLLKKADSSLRARQGSLEALEQSIKEDTRGGSNMPKLPVFTTDQEAA